MKKKTIVMFGLTLLSMASFIPSIQALALAGPWGPERDTFTWEVPAEYAVFNSIINNPELGDERNFVRIREVGMDKFVDEVKIVAGKEYEVYTYYHNNATDKKMINGKPIGQTVVGIADNVRMSSNFPAQIRAGERLSANSIITWINETAPINAVWDGAFMTTDENLVYLRYVPGTATIHNGGQLNGQGVGPDYLFSDRGAILGYNIFSGILPGCNQYAGYVTYKFKADKPDFTVTKRVSLYEQNNFVASVSSVRGNIVEFKVRYENTGMMVQENVLIKDTLPAGLEYQNGSTVLKNNSDTEGSVINDDIVMHERGVNIGTYAGRNGWAELTYRAKILDSAACGKMTNHVDVVTNDGTNSAEAEVEVICAPSELPESGPGEIVLAVVAVLAIGVGGTYWYRSQRMLKKVSDDVEGKE